MLPPSDGQAKTDAKGKPSRPADACGSAGGPVGDAGDRRRSRLTAPASPRPWTSFAAAAGLWFLILSRDAGMGNMPGTAVASVVFAAVGVWQVSPLKKLCLRHCRSPIAQLMHYASFTGPLREVRVAFRHAA